MKKYIFICVAAGVALLSCFFVFSIYFFTPVKKAVDAPQDITNSGAMITCGAQNLEGSIKCSFQEEWQYDYNANMLDIVGATAEFAQRHVKEACTERGMMFDRRSKPGATGGISDFQIEHEDRDGSVYAKMTGTFFCRP